MTSFYQKLRQKIRQLKNSEKWGSQRIAFIYLVIGLLWITCSDSLAHIVFQGKTAFMRVSAYKGFFYVIVTAYMLYRLIYGLSQKLRKADLEINHNYEELKTNASQLAQSEAKSRAMIMAIPDVLFLLDENGVFIDCESNDESKTLVPKAEFIGKKISDIMPPHISKKAYSCLCKVLQNDELQTFEYDLETEGIREFFEIRMVKKSDTEVLAILRDITLRKEMENQLEFLSYHDPLTGLFNRRYYEKELARLNETTKLPLSIVLGDVNGLKLINDSFGHDIGDLLIIKSARLIEKFSRPEYVLARLGGDEFVMLLPNTTYEETEQLVRAINLFAQTEKIKNIALSISFGYETKTEQDEDIRDIFTHAENYMYRRKLLESPHMRGKTIEAIIHTLNETNSREEQHSVRVSELCEQIGKYLHMNDRNVQELKAAGLMHDIGKIAIQETVLNKETRLIHEEYEEIKRHPEIGYRILNTIPEMEDISVYVLHHHEKWNGSGYPAGISGEDIPLESRIISIVDTYDAMVNDRSYRDSCSSQEAIEEIKNFSGIQFDPTIVDAFEQMLRETGEIK